MENKIRIDNIYIDKQVVLKFLGYGNRQVPSVILKKIKKEYKEVLRYIHPLVYLKNIKVSDVLNEEIKLENGIVLNGEHIYKSLKDCSSVYFSIYSVGAEIEKVISKHSSNNEMMRAMILDKMGVVALDFINESIKSYILENESPQKISCEVYPGDKDFKITNQKIIHNVFKFSDDIVSINEEFQLYPLKTVGVIFGIGNKECRDNRCDFCSSRCC